MGGELLNSPYLSDWEVIGQMREPENERRLDLSNFEDTYAMLNATAPDAILNLVGLTDVDRCESFPNEAYIGNVKTLESMVSWIKMTSKPIYLVHISTDQVYDGVGPHSEMNVSLKNYYAFSKYAGELIARSVESAVLRTNFFGRSKSAKRSSLTDWLFRSLSEERAIQVFEDVLFSPLSMKTLTKMIGITLHKKISGIYNLGSRNGLSKADFAYHFANELNLKTQLMSPIATAEVDFLKTYRPKDMRLNVNKFEQATGVALPYLTDEIKNVAREY